MPHDFDSTGSHRSAGVGAAWRVSLSGEPLRSAEALALQGSPSPIIRTLLKDVAPNTIDSPILFHEHLSIRYPLTKALAEAQGRPVQVSFSDDVELMIAETKAAGADGVRCIVDGGHPDMDRDLAALTRIAQGSGVHLVAGGGFYMQRNYPADIATRSADQITDELVRDAKAQRLGAFGEIGQQGGRAHRRREESVQRGREGAGAHRAAAVHAQRLQRRPRGTRRSRWTPRSGSSTYWRRAAPTSRTSRSATSAASTIPRRRSRSSTRSAACSSVSIGSASM